jgi:hypothetical protein
VRPHHLAYGLAALVSVLPLWVTGHLPFVDLPQHLYLISVRQRLADPSTLYPRFFEARRAVTPYEGYYAAVGALTRIARLDMANRIVISGYVVAMPLTMAFLLRSLGRPAWPSLFALPLAYGDSLAWGFLNYCTAIPLALVSCGLVPRILKDPRRRALWAVLLAVSLLATFAFHVQALVFAVLALLVLLVTTRVVNERGFLGGRTLVLVSALPTLALVGLWLAQRITRAPEVAFGAPWKAWGPLLSGENLAYKAFADNATDLPRVLANMLRDGSDRYGLYAAFLCAVAAVATSFVPACRSSLEGQARVERCRMLWLATLALMLFFLAPFDVRGYAYYVNTRYAQLAALLVLGSVPALRPRLARGLTVAAAAAAILTGAALARGFAAFDREARVLDTLVAATAPRPVIVGLVYDPSSRVVSHPVYLHAAADLARARGGVPNFSFALTPHSPIQYRATPPPTFPSEWRPEQFDFLAHGRAYDHFLLRGVPAARVFGGRLDTELYVAARADAFTLVRRR